MSKLSEIKQSAIEKFGADSKAISFIEKMMTKRDDPEITDEHAFFCLLEAVNEIFIDGVSGSAKPFSWENYIK